MSRPKIRRLPSPVERERVRRIRRVNLKRAAARQRALDEVNRRAREEAIARGQNPALVNQYSSMEMFGDFRPFAVVMRGGNRLQRKRAKRAGTIVPTPGPSMMVMSDALYRNLKHATEKR